MPTYGLITQSIRTPLLIGLVVADTPRIQGILRFAAVQDRLRR